MAKITKTRTRRYGDRDYRMSIRTKSGREFGGPFFDWLIPRWSAVAVFVAVSGLAFNVMGQLMTNKRLEVRSEKLVKQIKQAKADLKQEEENVKPNVVYQQVDVKSHNAVTVGNSVANAMMIVTKKQAVSTKDSVSDQDAVSAGNVIGKSLEKESDDWSKVKSWLKSPDWSLEFKSDVAFEGMSEKVLFLMKQGDGRIVGFVTALYNVSDEGFSDVKVTYASDVKDLKLEKEVKVDAKV